MDTPILVVCTGNLHRSPLLEAILRSNRFTSVSSAGLASPGGSVPLLMRQAALEVGIDLASHESRQISDIDTKRAAIVICMQRDHIARLSVMDPTSFRKTLMLREAVHLLRQNPPRRGMTLERWLHVSLEGRSASDVLRSPEDCETPDPIGGTMEDFRACVSDIRAYAEPLALGLSALVSRND